MYVREACLPVDLEFGVTSPYPDDLSPVAYSRQIQIFLSYAYRKMRAALGDVQRRQKMLYDCNIHGHPYKEGDMVWLHSTVVPPHSHRKLHHPWTGPYQNVSKLSDLNYKIAPVDDLSKTSVVHFDQLKFFSPNNTFFLSTLPLFSILSVSTITLILSCWRCYSP